MNLFYHPDASIGKTVVFEQAEALHLSKVLRKNSGDLIEVTDGKGFLYKAVLEVKKKEVSVTIIEGEQMTEAKQHLTLAIAPTKNIERLEWFIEKAVEISVSKISLLLCQHSERPHIRMDRLERVAISAMKQSLKFYLPEIHAMVPFQEWVQITNSSEKFIAHCYSNEPRKLLKESLKPGRNAIIAIGPEGDFSPAEVAMSLRHGFVGVSLGNARLRSETAALVAVHTFELINQS